MPKRFGDIRRPRNHEPWPTIENPSSCCGPFKPFPLPGNTPGLSAHLHLAFSTARCYSQEEHPNFIKLFSHAYICASKVMFEEYILEPWECPRKYEHHLCICPFVHLPLKLDGGFRKLIAYRVISSESTCRACVRHGI